MNNKNINSIDLNNYLFIQNILERPLDLLQDLVRKILPSDKTLKISQEEKLILKKRFKELLKRDLENVQKSYYPKTLLFQIPYFKYLKNTPLLLIEVLKMYYSIKNNLYNNLPKNVDLSNYPNYFTRNFHWQSDGYFSYKSAEIYDIGVELLFLGTADIMRRQIIPPITNFLKDKDITNIKMLDVACGTSRVINQINKTHPNLDITGIDISPFYIEYSKNNIKSDKIQFLQANAESLPFEDNSFDIVSSVYLFHELPRNTRKKVLSEMYRVLKKDSLLVIEDSIQLNESKEIENVIYRFCKEFHEPYYKDYVQNPIENFIEESGFNIINSEYHYVSKVVISIK
ncbi:MAG: class I SAM-dependent methyltransferase [Candidatus Sericytochromatia bacterium]